MNDAANHVRNVPVIAIDGPGGAGKGTAAHQLAVTLGWHILDSGAIYRVLGLAALRRGIEPENEHGLVELALALDVDFVPNAEKAGLNTILDGDDVSKDIRSEEAGMMASKVARLSEVRSALLERQRGFARTPGLVADGRDMGTVVFPNAPLKVYLTASVEARAKRRYDQLIAQGLSGNLARLSEAIRARDEADMNRAVAPLKPADDAIQVDSTEMSIDEVGDLLFKLASERGLV